jgi:capsular polysaccharide biosynthesis protein
LNLKEFLAAVGRYRRTAVLVAGALLAIGLAGILLMPAKYVSTTQLMVSIEGSTTADAYQNDEVVAGRVNSYIALMTSGVVVQRVIDKLGLPLNASDLAAKISATNVPPRTAIIDVAVTDESPARAQQVAATLAHEFISYTEALETPTGEDGQKVHTTVVTDASEPRERSAERVVLGLLAAASAVLMAAVAVWVRTRTDPVIRSGHQAASAAGVPVIGCVTDDLEGYRRLRTRVRSMMNSTKDNDRGRVLVLASAAGELDTMSVASNVGRAMELAGNRSIVLDARLPQPDVGDREPAVADGTDADTTDKTEPNPGPCVDVSSPTNDPAGPDRRAEGFPDTLSVSEWTAKPDQLATKATAEFVDWLRGDYEQVLVPAPPVLLTVTASTVAEYADGVILVVSPGTTKRRDVARAAADLRATGAPLIGLNIGKNADFATITLAQSVT